MPGLEVKNLSYSYKDKSILEDVCLEINPGEFAGILGPNGSGKTTLLNNINRWLVPQKGSILIEEQKVESLSPKTLAQYVATVPQETSLDLSFTVEEIVMMGRNPYLKTFEREKPRDKTIIEECMKAVGIWNLKDRYINELSGGEKQRALIARALAQQPKVLVLDEPISHLDINYKWEILELLKNLCKNMKIIVLAVLHDINLASLFCDKLLLLKDGKIFKSGSPEEVITEQNIREVFDVDVKINIQPQSGRPMITFISPVHKDTRPRSCERIHVVCGGGAGEKILQYLRERGYQVSAGVLNIGDTDWKTAKNLGVDVIEDLPFSPVSEEKAEENKLYLDRAEAIIICNIPFGHGNLKNLILLRDVVAKGEKKIFVLHETPIGQRDYTGGLAAKIYSQILKESVVINSIEELRDFF
ncbi:ABC transporter ATP-binding protein [Thermosediminibacter oceani]|uniref:ABC transporter related protein n=1 Tax=Thermosediminibacter oceani (strain ATCC BAA-1034 / DSM 16646 / JW/IW-1228P) TaxID=555079 RepID=D9S3D5_THEOJ|nr:ABC transporter ATP-binding protein [Thermosediminibacter oceani]ADL07912.1 ABC transporter related protein [Thermosediminibacter oceani DSM 16646]